jgi:hypothetical protein
LKRLSSATLFACDVASLERLARHLGCAPPRRWRTPGQRKTKLVVAIQRAEKALERQDRSVSVNRERALPR